MDLIIPAAKLLEPSRMKLLLLSLFSMATVSHACSSLGSLIRSTSGAPAGLTLADCSFIQANSAAICNTLGSWDIVNGDGCQQRGPGYGCQFSNTPFSTQDVFYCQAGPAPTATASHSSNPTPSSSSSSSASASPSVSSSASPSVSASASPSESPSLTSSASPSITPSASPSARVTPSATATRSSTATATSTSTHTVNPVFIYINTTEYVTVKESSIDKGEAAAIGLSSIFGMSMLVYFFLMLFRMRKNSKETIEIPERRPSMVLRRPSRTAV